jgi:hypothetical protein
VTEPDSRTTETTPLRAIAPEHAELKSLFAYWLAKKGDRRAPSRADIDPLEIAALLPYVVLIDVERRPWRFRYRLVGTDFVQNVGDDLTGHYLDEFVRLERGQAILEDYIRVADWGAPVCAVWDYRRGDGRHVRYERLALPLSSDGRIVDMLFGGAVFDAAFGGISRD